VNPNLKTGVFWLVLTCVALLLWQVVKAGKNRPDRAITFTEFIREVEAGKLKSVSITNGIDVKGIYKDNGTELDTLIPENYMEIYRILQDHQVEIDIKKSGQGWISVLINASPFLLLLAFWIFMMRQMQGRRPPPSAI
jgi:cell division protease FtsH